MGSTGINVAVITGRVCRQPEIKTGGGLMGIQYHTPTGRFAHINVTVDSDKLIKIMSTINRGDKVTVQGGLMCYVNDPYKTYIKATKIMTGDEDNV